MDFTLLSKGIQKRFANFVSIVSLSDCLLCDSQISKSPIGQLCHVCYQDLSRFPLGLDVLIHNPKLASGIKHTHYDGFACLTKYQWPFDMLIKQLKYHNQINRGRVLGELLAEHLKHMTWPKLDYVCPLPLHKNKLAKRGFNQSEILCRFLTKKLNIKPFYELRRIKNTEAQAELTRKERLENVKNAFHCDKDLQSKRILLIDDVLTTGATLEQASKVLKRCGAKQVFVATIAIKPFN